MSTAKPAARRSARRIGVESGANFEERRKLILTEAARAFVENGVQGTSLDDVAARLGVTKPALYHYVSGKEDLIRLCLSAGIEFYEAFLTDAVELEGTGLDKLRLLFRRWAMNATTDFGRAIVLIDSHSLGGENRKKHLDAHRKILRRVEQLIKDGIADGSIRPCDPVVTTLSLTAIFNSPANWYRKEGPLSVEEIVEELLSLLEKGIAT